MKKKYTFLIFAMLLGSTLWAQQPLRLDTIALKTLLLLPRPVLNDMNTFKTGEESDDISIDEDEDAFYIDSICNLLSAGIIDSALIPAASIYNYVWNNQTVNPYAIRMADMIDTLIVDLSGYSHPIKNQKITSEFGFRRSRFHYGIDVKLNTGDTLCSAFDGMVRIAKRGRAYGNYVVIRHFNGLETVYGHLSKIYVSPNQIVRSGEAIGLGGSTGRSTGPHLHYEIRYLGQAINPRDIVDFDAFDVKIPLLNICNQHFAYVKEIEAVRYWTVKRGDTLGRIAQRTGISIRRLCQLNKLTTKSILRVGQRIRYT